MRAGGVARRLRRVPTVVWLVTVLFAGLGVFHSYLTPLGSTPDEATHVDLVFHLAEGGSYPEFDGRRTSKAAMDALYVFHQSEAIPNVPDTAASLGPAFTRTFSQWGGDITDTHGTYNQMAQHPPLYYVSMAAAVRVDRLLRGGPGPWFGEWHRARLASFAPMLVLPVLAWASARRLRASDTAAVSAAASTLAVPQLFHVTSGLNNDTHLVVLGAVLAWLLAGVLAGRCRPRDALGVGAVTGLALLTKAFAVVFPVWIVVVFATRAARHPSERRGLLVGLGLAGVVTAAVAGWWWISNLVRHGTPVPTTERWLYTEAMRTPGFEPDPLWFLQRVGAWLPRRFVGWFGWLELPLTWWVAVAVCLAFGAAGVVTLVRPGAGPSRLHLLAFASALPLLVAFVVVRAWDLYVTTSRTPFIQGRYLFSAFVPLAVLVGVGVTRVLGRAAPLVLVAGGALVQAEAVRVMLLGFWGEPGSTSVARAVEGMVAWNPGPVDPRWVGVLGVAVPLVATLVAADRIARPRVVQRPEGARSC